MNRSMISNTFFLTNIIPLQKKKGNELIKISMKNNGRETFKNKNQIIIINNINNHRHFKKSDFLINKDCCTEKHIDRSNNELNKIKE